MRIKVKVLGGCAQTVEERGKKLPGRSEKKEKTR